MAYKAPFLHLRKKRLRMTSTDISLEKYTLAIIDRSSRSYDLAALSSAHELIADCSNLIYVNDIKNLEKIEMEDICVALIFVDSNIELDLVDLNKLLEHLISKHRDVLFITMLIAPRINAKQKRIIYDITGVNIICENKDLQDIMLLSLGVVRTFMYVRSGRKITLAQRISNSRSVNRMFVGEWILLPDEAAIRTPNGQVIKLSPSEWNFVHLLYSRDVAKIEIDSDVAAKFLPATRQNALVYKIKEKVGSNFPIVANKGGGYRMLDKV